MQFRNQNIHAVVTKQTKNFSTLLFIPITLLCYAVAYYISCSTIKLTLTCVVALLPFLSRDINKTNYIQNLHCCAYFPFPLSATLLLHLHCYAFHYNSLALLRIPFLFSQQTTKLTFTLLCENSSQNALMRAFLFYNGKSFFTLLRGLLFIFIC